MNQDELLPIPPMESATEPVHSDADLCQRWRALMGPLGFGQRLLWVGFLGPNRRLVKTLSQVPIGKRPQRATLQNLMSSLRTVLEGMTPGTTLAMLLTGPGHGPVTAAERLWCKSLTEIADRFGIPIQPIFRANDESLVQVTPT